MTNRRMMTIGEVRQIAYKALGELDELLFEDPDDQPGPEWQNIRQALFRLAGGVVWEEMQPKQAEWPAEPSLDSLVVE